MKKVIYLESFAGYPDTTLRTNTTVLEDAVTTYTPTPTEYGFTLPIFYITKSYGSRGSYIGSITVDGKTYRGLMENHSNLYGHIQYNIPKMELGSNKRMWFGCRISSNTFKTTIGFVAMYGGTTTTARLPSTGAGTYYIEVAVDAKTQQYYIYLNKTLVQTMAFSNADKSYIPLGGNSIIHMGNCSAYTNATATAETCYSDLYVAVETWGEEEEAPAPAPFGPVRVASRNVSKVDADLFSTNNTSKEAAVQQIMEPTAKLTANPLFTDSEGASGSFKFEQKAETKTPLAYQVSLSARRGVSAIGKLVSKIKDETTSTTFVNEQPPLQTSASIPVYIFCSSTKLDGSPLDADYINKLSVEAHSEEG